MKHHIIKILGVLLIISSCEKEIDVPVQDITFDMPSNTYANGSALQEVLDTYVKKGLVGVSLAVDDPVNGFWAGASKQESL